MRRLAVLIGLCAMAPLAAVPPPGAPTVSVSLALSASGNFRLPQTVSVSTALAANGLFRLPATVNVPINLSAKGLFAESGGGG